MFFTEFQGHFHVVYGSSSGYYGDFSVDFDVMEEVTLTLFSGAMGVVSVPIRRVI